MCTHIYNSVYGLSCKDEMGNDVISWTIFKLPAGTTYYYYEHNTSAFSQSPYSLNDTEHGAATYTMDQLWKDTSIQYVLYNDEQPFQLNYNFSVGHAKAVLMWNSGGGIMIQHSVPKWPYGPAIVEGYVGLPSNAYTYGQHMTCFPVTLGDVKIIAASLMYVVPNIYDYRCSGEECVGEMSEVIGGSYNSSAVCRTWTLHNMYTLFQKTTQWGQDLWDGCVGVYYASNLYVESWIHGNAIGPVCTPYQTLDIMNLDYMGSSFSEYNDHSKWAIGSAEKDGGSLVCMGDINRMTTQFVRGGGALCWSDSVLWGFLHSSIVQSNTCV